MPNRPTILAAIVVCFFSFAGLIFYPVFSPLFDDTLLAVQISGFIVISILFGGSIILRHRHSQPMYDRSNLELPNIRLVGLTFGIFIGVILLGYCTMSPLSHQLTLLMQSFYRNPSVAPDTPITWSNGIFAVVLAPCIEELTFRGVLLQGFLARYKPSIAIISNTILFVILHGFGGNTPSHVVLTLAICFVYYLSNSLWLCIELHILHNLLIFCQDLLEQFFALKLFEILEHFSPYQIQYWLLTGVGLVCCGLSLHFMAKMNRQHKSTLLPIDV
jgi:membrane protease YdiL (CAAX protease family)